MAPRAHWKVCRAWNGVECCIIARFLPSGAGTVTYHPTWNGLAWNLQAANAAVQHTRGICCDHRNWGLLACQAGLHPPCMRTHVHASGFKLACMTCPVFPTGQALVHEAAGSMVCQCVACRSSNAATIRAAQMQFGCEPPESINTALSRAALQRTKYIRGVLALHSQALCSKRQSYHSCSRQGLTTIGMAYRGSCCLNTAPV